MGEIPRARSEVEVYPATVSERGSTWNMSARIPPRLSSRLLAWKCTFVVVDSGTADLGKWMTVTRNLRDDFTKAFGWSPDRNVGGIGFMTDSDNTRSSAEAYYGPVTIGK